MTICVFCASSQNLAPEYYHQAQKLGKIIAQEGHTLVYGGTCQGLMKSLAEGALQEKGSLKGVIPACISALGVADSKITELIETSDMKERKAVMRECSDAFIALPGGWGTLEEITEVITLKQLGQHNKPIVFINTQGFYNTFFAFIEEATRTGFISTTYRSLYEVVNSPEEAMKYIRNYKIGLPETKYPTPD